MTPEDYTPQAGDVFACWGTDWMSRVISVGTSSVFGPRSMWFGPSHVAIACPRWWPGNHLTNYWWESTTLTTRPCLEAGKPVSGCQVHVIRDRINDYVQAGGKVQVYRLTGFDWLTHRDVMELRTMLGETVGDILHPDRVQVTYDTTGAVISRLRLIRRLTEWRNQLNAIFCAELLAAVLQRLGRISIDNPARFTPAQLMRQLLTQGTYRLHTEFLSRDDRRLKNE